MKKLLTWVLALVMGIGCLAAFAGCGGGDNAALATEALQSIKTMYENKALDTPEDYPVIGQTSASNGKRYTVNWSVSTTDSVTLSDYVKVGTMDPDTKIVMIEITQGEVAVNYTLKATVKVGNKSDSVEFAHRVPVKATEGNGDSVESPFSVTQAFSVGKKLSDGMYYDGQTETGVAAADAVRVYIKGFVVDPGKTTAQGGKYAGGVQYVYIVDEYSADKNSYSEDALKIGSLTWNDVLTEDNLLENGEEIIVSGLLEIYNNTVTLYAPSVNGTYVNSYCEWRASATEQTPQQKVDAAYNAVSLSKTVYNETGNYDLPTAHSNGATYSWSVKTDANNLVEITDNKLNVKTIPEAEESVVLNVTIEYAGATAKDKDITIKIAPAVSASHQGTLEDPLTVAETIALLDTLSSGETYQEGGVDKAFYIKGYITNPGTIGSYGANNVYIADEMGGTPTALVYAINWDSTVWTKTSDALEVDDLIIVRGYLKNFNGTKEVAQSGSGSSADYPTIASLTKPQLSEAQKVQKALNALEIPAALTADYPLPASTVDGVTFSIESTTNTAIAIEGTTLKVTRPDDADKTGDVVVKATCGSASDTKTFSVTVKMVSDKTETTLYTLDTATCADGTNNSYASNCDITVEGIVWNLTGNSTMHPWRIGGKSLTNQDRSVYSKTAIEGQVTEIAITFGTATSITVNSVTLKVYSDASRTALVSTQNVPFAANSTQTVTAPSGEDWSNCYYEFVFNVTVTDSSSNRFVQLSKIVFTGYEA